MPAKYTVKPALQNLGEVGALEPPQAQVDQTILCNNRIRARSGTPFLSELLPRSMPSFPRHLNAV